MNAFADFDAERVRERARKHDAWHGTRSRRPLFGLPVTVKSSIATRGLKCEIGSLLHQGDVSREDAVVVARLRAAGALILGTTNCPEFLMAYETANLLHGRTNNPWDLERTPGGSSGGESAAIAAGLSAAGLGSDSGGSVRVPAHFTGICSLKPTPGRIPGRGHLPPCVGPFSTLGAIGPMARTIDDVALMFRTLSGQDPRDPVSPPIALREPSLDELRANTIGFFEDDGLVPVTPETRAAVQAAAAALRDAGFRVEPFRPRTLELLRQLWWKFFVQCGAMFYAPAIRGREHQLSPIFSEFLSFSEALPPLTAQQLLDAWAELDLIRCKDSRRDERSIRCCCAPWPAFPPSATASANGSSRGAWWITSTPCATRSGSTRWPALQRWFQWAALSRDCRSACRLLRGLFRMKPRWALQPLWIRPLAIGRLPSLCPKYYCLLFSYSLHSASPPFDGGTAWAIPVALSFPRTERARCVKIGANDLPKAPIA